MDRKQTLRRELQGFRARHPKTGILIWHLNYLEQKALEKQQMREGALWRNPSNQKQVIKFPMRKVTSGHQEENILTTRGTDTKMDLYKQTY